jgi:hypothetical protein
LFCTVIKVDAQLFDVPRKYQLSFAALEFIDEATDEAGTLEPNAEEIAALLETLLELVDVLTGVKI